MAQERKDGRKRRGFPENPVLRELVERVVAFLDDKPPGFLLAHEETERITGLDRYVGSWGSVVKKLKDRMLRERGIELWPAVGVGYELSTPQQQLFHNNLKNWRGVTRKITRTQEKIYRLPTAELTDYQIIQRANKIDRLTDLNRQWKREEKEQKKAAEPRQAMPTLAAVLLNGHGGPKATTPAEAGATPDGIQPAQE